MHNLFCISQSALPVLSELIPWDDSTVVAYDIGIDNIKIINRRGVITVSGVLLPTSAFYGSSLEALRTLVAYALKDERIDSIILNINSPGGSVAGTEETAAFIKKASQIKPITAFVIGSATSAAYWIASACKEIVMSETAEVGSIGAVLAVGKSGNQAIVTFTSKYAPNKNIDPESPEGQTEYQTRVDDIGAVFIRTVAANRGMEFDEVITAGNQGGVLGGVKAVKAGLADRIGSLNDLINDTEIKKTEDEMSLKSLEQLKTDHKEIYAQAAADGVPHGIEKENKRITGILAIKAPAGCESIISAAVADPKATVESVKDQILAHLEKESAEASAQAINLLKDTPAPVQQGGESPEGTDTPEKRMAMEGAAALNQAMGGKK